MQSIELNIKIQTNENVTPEHVAKLVQRLIDSGLSEAGSISQSGEGDTQYASLATSLSINAPTVAVTPKVLVIVEGGMADPIWEGNVDVEVFDWDNYNDDPENRPRVPEHFASLAEPVNVPVETVEGDNSEDNDDGISSDDMGSAKESSSEEKLYADYKLGETVDEVWRAFLAHPGQADQKPFGFDVIQRFEFFLNERDNKLYRKQPGTMVALTLHEETQILENLADGLVELYLRRPTSGALKIHDKTLMLHAATGRVIPKGDMSE